MFLEIIKFFIYSSLIVIISKYILVKTLRRLAENLNLKPKTVGEVAGVATSVPELLTISISSFNGLISASIVNVLSSNIINLVQYLFSVLLNKNREAFKNKAIKTDMILVLITIILPIILIVLNIEINVNMIFPFIVLYMLFRFLNTNVHKLYLEKEDEILEKQIEKEQKWEKGNKRKTVKYATTLIVTGILLFVVGNELGIALENLCNEFNVSQIIIGILLGFITSVPELITFFEAQKHYKKKKNNDILGVIEATNNLLTSNMLNLFIIQVIGIVVFNLFY